MKYIIFDDTYPVIISGFTSHNEIIHTTSSILNREPTSAGEFHFVIKKDSCGNELAIPECYGKSISLRLESKVTDSYIIAKAMYDFVELNELKNLCNFQK